MASQMERLRDQFNGMNNTQKKQFIEKLEQKLEGVNNPEYTKFLDECVQSYNAENSKKEINKESPVDNIKETSKKQIDSIINGSLVKKLKLKLPIKNNLKIKKDVESQESVCRFCSTPIKLAQKRCSNCLMVTMYDKKCAQLETLC